jgi:uncharacterized RmlC-like cupin family protein
MSEDRIVTIRPVETTDTRQRLPAFVGASAATAGATGIGMILVVIRAGVTADAHLHEGFETAILILSGRIETRYGDGLREVCLNEPGAFSSSLPACPISRET